jgi:hypothetical protein
VFVEVLFGHRFEWREFVHAGVVNQDVEPAEKRRAVILVGANPLARASRVAPGRDLKSDRAYDRRRLRASFAGLSCNRGSS